METAQQFAKPFASPTRLPIDMSCQADGLFQQVTESNAYPAFCQLFRLYYQPLCQYAVRFVRLEEVAEEIVADVFVKLWKNRAQIRLYASFHAYCYRAVKNQSLDYLKSSSRYYTLHSELTDAHSALTTCGESPEQDFIDQELGSLLNRAVAQLPKQGQLIYRMSRDQGLKYREIAGQLGISVRTVETHMSRSCQTLKARLQDYY